MSTRDSILSPQNMIGKPALRKGNLVSHRVLNIIFARGMLRRRLQHQDEYQLLSEALLQGIQAVPAFEFGGLGKPVWTR